MTTGSAAGSPPDAANRLWLTDITEHRTGEGELYLCAIKDVHCSRIVGYSDRLEDESVYGRRGPAERDPAARARRHGRALGQEAQFRSRKFVKALRHNGLVGSMGRVGACGDNAAMESFFALLQENALDRQRWQTRLGRLTPIEFETINRHATAA